MWSLGIVFVLPSQEFCLCVLQREEPVLVQTLLPEPRVEGFDQGIVRWPARPTEVKFNMVPVGPSVKIFRDELGSIVHLDPFREAVLMRDTLQRCHDIEASDPRVRIECQAFAREVLDDDQYSKAAIVEQLIGDEVHAPTFVPGQCGWPDLPFDAGNPSTRRFLTHYQAFRAIEPVDPFVIDLPALTA